MQNLGLQYLWYVCGYCCGLKKLMKQQKVSITIAVSLSVEH